MSSMSEDTTNSIVGFSAVLGMLGDFSARYTVDVKSNVLARANAPVSLKCPEPWLAAMWQPI